MVSAAESLPDLHYYIMYTEFRRLAKNDRLTLAFGLRFVYNIKEENCFEIVNLITRGRVFDTKLLECNEIARQKPINNNNIRFWTRSGSVDSDIRE